MKLNESLSIREQKLLEYFFDQELITKKIGISKDLAYKQINSSCILRDISPYRITLEFIVDKTKVIPFDGDYGVTVSFDVVNEENDIPVCFDLHLSNNYIEMFEVYNADSSELDYNKMCIGSVKQVIWPHQKHKI